MYKISGIISLLGIGILLIIAKSSEPMSISISEIKKNELNKQVSITGTIINSRIIEKSNFQVTTIHDESGSIDIISEKTNLTKNKKIKVIGTITLYKNNKQIQANKIILVP